MPAFVAPLPAGKEKQSRSVCAGQENIYIYIYLKTGYIFAIRAIVYGE